MHDGSSYSHHVAQESEKTAEMAHRIACLYDDTLCHNQLPAPGFMLSSQEQVCLPALSSVQPLAQGQPSTMNLSQLFECFRNAMQELKASRQTLDKMIKRCKSLKGMSAKHLQSQMSRSEDQMLMAKQPSLQAGSEAVNMTDDCQVCSPHQQV